jgi:nucleotide-binding universal stress UspA family protein
MEDVVIVSGSRGLWWGVECSSPVWRWSSASPPHGDRVSDSRGKVVVGISSSLSGLEALRFAITEAHRRQAPLAAVRVWSFRTGPRSRPGREWERELAVAARRAITGAFRIAVGEVPADLDVVARAMPGPVDVALKACVSSPHDLLVIGAARRRWLSGVVRGCAHDARCPVVVVPRPELARVIGGRMAARRMMREAEAALARSRGTDGR